MVTTQKMIKKRKNAVKLLLGSKQHNVKPKLDKLNKKQLKQNANEIVNTAQVCSEIKNLRDIKKVKEKIRKGIKGKVHIASKSADCEVKQETGSEIEDGQYVKLKKHVDVDKTDIKMEGDNEMKHILKTKRFTINKVEDEKTCTDTNDDSKTAKVQKRKRVDSVSNDVNADCLDLTDLSKEHILQCIRAIFHLTEEQLKSKNALFDGESQPIFMQVTCIRVPKTPRRCMRILIPHSIVQPSEEVALFVGDLQRGRKQDYELTIEHYEDLLRKHGCKRIKSIIPMNQVKTEYDQFELKRKLVGSYDHFLVDGKIAGHLSHLLGKEFYKKRKLPTSVRMQSKDLKHEIDYALRKTFMQIHSHGDTHIIQIGHTLMSMEQIVENILATCNYLSKNYPGGWSNIRCVRIKTSSSLSLPIYATLKNKNLVDVPVVKPKRPKAYREVTGELTTAPGIDSVTITPEGNVTVIKKRGRIPRK